MERIGPFLNAKDAAAYCCFTYTHFARLRATYRLPRYGPNRNRYAQADLEKWMKDPTCFMNEDKAPIHRVFQKIEVRG